MEWFNKLSARLQNVIIFLSFIAGLYAVLTPPMIVFKYYMTTEIREVVKETVVSISEKTEKNKDDISTIRGVLNHYHSDVNRFWQRSGGYTSSCLIPYKVEP